MIDLPGLDLPASETPGTIDLASTDFGLVGGGLTLDAPDVAENIESLPTLDMDLPLLEDEPTTDLPMLDVGSDDLPSVEIESADLPLEHFTEEEEAAPLPLLDFDAPAPAEPAAPEFEPIDIEAALAPPAPPVEEPEPVPEVVEPPKVEPPPPPPVEAAAPVVEEPVAPPPPPPEPEPEPEPPPAAVLEQPPPPPPPQPVAPPAPEPVKVEAPKPPPAKPAAPKVEAPAEPTKPAPARKKGEYVDLSGFLDEDAEERRESSRFVVAEKPPTGDEERDFADMLSQFKQKVSENISIDDAAAHYDLGIAFKEMGLIDEAIGEFQTAMSGGEERLKVYEELGACFLLKQQYNVALNVLNRALQVPVREERDLIGVYYSLARSYEELGQRDEAKAAYERVISLDINFQDATKRLGKL
jgi:hypothetical protein